MALIWVTDAQYVSDYKIALTFNDGFKKTVDMQPCLYGTVFEPLKDIDNFKKFHVSDWSVEWYNGADLSPEFLYSL
jgi:hypothetical protein